MADGRSGPALLRLLAFLSPAFPTGSFSYSQGLEGAVHDALVSNADDLRAWLLDLLRNGPAWNDAVLLAESWRRVKAGGDIADLAELAEALAGSAERHLETTLQGAAFVKAASAWPASADDGLPPDCPYPLAIGGTAAAHGIALGDTLAGYLHAFASNMLQAAIRLSVIGQSEALAILAALERPILDLAGSAERSTLDDLGACTISAEIAALRHETQYSRLFRS